MSVTECEGCALDEGRAEQRKMHAMFHKAMIGLDAKPNGSFFRGYRVQTDAGRLRVSFDKGHILTQFADPEMARGKMPLDERLSDSGHWNFRFWNGEKASSAIFHFLLNLSRVRPDALEVGR